MLNLLRCLSDSDELHLWLRVDFPPADYRVGFVVNLLFEYFGKSSTLVCFVDVEVGFVRG